MITGYIGDRGSGKTLSMTIDLYDNYHLKGKNIYSNYELDLKNARILDKAFFEDFRDSEYKLEACAVAVDEAHVFIDSRRSMSPRNIMFSKFITQSRKRGVDLKYTTQEVSIEKFYASGQVELRLRKLTDEVIFCKTLSIINKKVYVNYEELINPKKDKMFCINFIYRGGILMGKRIIFANPYFSKFDTNEIVDLDF